MFLFFLLAKLGIAGFCSAYLLEDGHKSANQRFEKLCQP